MTTSLDKVGLTVARILILVIIFICISLLFESSRYVTIKLIPEITIGDIISGISVIFFCWFTHRALKQTRKNMERPRIIELLRKVIFPMIDNLQEKIRYIEKGIVYYGKSFVTIEDTYRNELIFIEFKDRYPEILEYIRKLDSIFKSTKEKYNELHNTIFEEIKDESIKKIKTFNEKSDIKLYENIKDKTILNIIENEFVDYILGFEPTQTSRKIFWNEYGEQLSEARKKGKEIESSIEEDVNKIRELIRKTKPRLTAKRDSLMKEYGIEPESVKRAEERF